MNDEQYPCGECNQNCADGSIFCEKCRKWFHATCESLNKVELKRLGNMSLAFTCCRCRTPEYDDTIRQLGSHATSLKQLKTAAQVVRLGIPKDFTHIGKDLAKRVTLPIDDQATKLLQISGGVKTHVPVVVSDNGNCLFNAVSVSLIGDESLTHELRVRASLELLNNAKYYETTLNHSDLHLVSPTIEDSTLACATDRKWAGPWEMAALSTVIGRSIRSVYPAVNGLLDRCISILNRTFQPRNSFQGLVGITIMWAGGDDTRNTWSPNHFVPLLPATVVCAPSLDVVVPSATTPPCYVIPVLPSEASLKTPTTKVATKTAITTPEQDFSYNIHEFPSLESSVAEVKKTVHPIKRSKLKLQKNSDNRKRVHFTLATSTSTPVTEKTFRFDYSLSPIENTITDESLSDIDYLDVTRPADSYDIGDTNQDNIIDNVPTANIVTDEGSGSIMCDGQDINASQIPSQVPSIHKHPTGMPLPQAGKFMETSEVYKHITSCQATTDQIPNGEKNNVYFVLDNSQNIARRSDGCRSKYYDDCGVWNGDKGGTPKAHFILRGSRLVSVYKKEGNYCHKRKQNKQTVYVPVDPQPSDNEIVVIRRYYTTLKCDNTYKKRVTCLEKIPADIDPKYLSYALVEYVGSFPGNSLHGNSKRSTTTAYIRTDPEVLSKIQTMATQGNTPMNIYSQLVNEGNDHPSNAPRDSHQVRNSKYFAKKNNTMSANKHNNNNAHSNNFADHMLAISNMVLTHPFVQTVNYAKHHVPSVVLYTKDNLELFKYMCCEKENPSVAGIDKTFNLGKVFVTPITFKHQGILKKETADNPIVFGPMLIHGSSTFQTYHQFLSHVASSTGLTDFQNLTIGTDDERAIRNAVKACFSKVTNVLCTRHLTNNTEDYLRNKVGVPKGTRIQIKDAIFGERGIVNADDSVTLEQRIDNVNKIIPDKQQNDRFKQYLSKRLLPLLVEGVMEPCRKHANLHTDWTNNNSESANHILKCATNWKVLPLQELIEKLYQITRTQEKDIIRALIGTGNYTLAPSMIHYSTSPNVWETLTAEQKHRKVMDFTRDRRKRKQGNVVQSTDGCIRVTMTPSAGRKPGQRKRPTTERTFTPRKKSKLSLAKNNQETVVTAL